ncbi:hypothetical protein D0962_17835 [Leptolyngbyaceae cyanobacterium CCMR0082]|uniref:Uncharacterized protein n=1 Tax=Adonisia turfae CCMR0082 TaxID=2304604 RepID=A0A6M0S8E4_9CYAN|nr:hypothetical protein [Adonisia turfae]NEZ64626.1 hypothetical protein [Adonisia turfae CCMR0082]
MKNLLTEQLKIMLSDEFAEPFDTALASLEDYEVRFIRRMFSEGTPVLCVLRSPAETQIVLDDENEDIEKEVHFDDYWLEFWSFWGGRFSNALNCKLDLYEAIVNAQPELSPMLTPEINYYKERFPGSKPREKCCLKGGVYVGNFVMTPSESVAEECLSHKFFRNLSITQKVCFTQSFRSLMVPSDISFEEGHSLQDQIKHWIEQGRSINPARSRSQLRVIQGGRS